MAARDPLTGTHHPACAHVRKEAGIRPETYLVVRGMVVRGLVVRGAAGVEPVPPVRCFGRAHCMLDAYPQATRCQPTPAAGDRPDD